MARRPVVAFPAAADAARVLGQQIKMARHERQWTVAEFAERLGVSPVTVRAIENGAHGTAIGTVFNAAVLTGVDLFGTDDKAELARLRRRGEERLNLMARRVRPPALKEADDLLDF
ncbi:MAG: helix-turn-helix transcriptional regulator [Aeromicrobium sp.]|uniref:helix-turn-helix transcriptional regulator n=1 Tax=Aeromicrobium sp. TaxID=1871063 RepID=UPI0039E2EB61